MSAGAGRADVTQAGRGGAVAHGDEAAHDLVIGGRRWRASDPGIPAGLRTELVHELMAARRAVRAAAGEPQEVAAARRRVQDAKVALGERGAPWWEPAPVGAMRERIAATVRTLLGHRGDGTICPSEVARVVASPEWRAVMPLVREVAVGLAGRGQVLVRQRGRVVDPTIAKGPVRYGRGSGFPHAGRVEEGNSPILDV